MDAQGSDEATSRFPGSLSEPGSWAATGAIVTAPRIQSCEGTRTSTTCSRRFSRQPGRCSICSTAQLREEFTAGSHIGKIQPDPLNLADRRFVSKDILLVCQNFR